MGFVAAVVGGVPFESLATLIAACIAGVAAIVAAVLGAINAWRTRQWTGRQQWWERFSWACEKAVSDVPEESELGLSVLTALIDAPWAKEEDNDMAIAVGNVIVSRESNAKKGSWKK